MSFSGKASQNNSKSSGTFSGTDTSNKTTDYTQNSTPTNPDWVTSAAPSLWSGAQSLAGANPQSYVAGPNALQGQAVSAAGGLTGTPWNYDGALDVTRGVTGAAAPQTQAVQAGPGATASPFIKSYMDPYLSNVVNATAADMDRQAAQTRAQQSLDLNRSGALGGSGAAINQSLTEGALTRARATTLSGLQSQGYAQAVNAAQQDAVRKQQAAQADADRQQAANNLNASLQGQQSDRSLAAAQQLAGISDQFGATQRANIGAQGQAGGELRAIQQQQAAAPLDLQNWLGQYFAGLPTNLFHGVTANGTQTEAGTDTQQGTQSTKGSNTGFGFGATMTQK